MGFIYYQIELKHKQKDLPSSFTVSRPILTTTSEPSFRRAIDSPKHGICWSRGWDRREVIQTASGKIIFIFFFLFSLEKKSIDFNLITPV